MRILFYDRSGESDNTGELGEYGDSSELGEYGDSSEYGDSGESCDKRSGQAGLKCRKEQWVSGWWVSG